MGFYFSGDGRVSRKDFWLRWILVYVALVILAFIIDVVAFAELTRRLSGNGPVSTILGFVLLWPTFAVSAKRFHDRGMSGWWPLWLFLASFALLIAFVVGLILSGLDPNTLAPGEMPDFAQLNGTGVAVMAITGLVAIALALFQIIVLAFLPGQVGPNRYGPDPLRPELGQPG